MNDPRDTNTETSPADSRPETDHTEDAASGIPDLVTLGRLALGGGLMGVANLVPGISGGTMLVAAGVYQAFIDAIADLSRLRPTKRAVSVLAVVVLAAGVFIAGLASLVTSGLESFRWGMYSLFIGLTLGGVPLLARMVRPMTPGAWIGLGSGALVMLGLVAVQSFAGGSGRSDGIAMLFLGGIAGASAMILPGVSGAYLLLLLGVYDTILESIRDGGSAAVSGDLQGAFREAMMLVPVGVGVVVGIVVVSNVLKVVLHKFEKPTLGVLLGLLLAAPAGLYPFREGVPPAIGETFEGVVVTEENFNDWDAKDWPERSFRPSALQIVGSLGLTGVGLAVTLGVARLGCDRPSSRAD